MASSGKKRGDTGEIRRHYEAVLEASGATYSALRVLQALVWRAEFDENKTCVSKEELMRRARCGRTTVKEALKFLRAEGSIVPIQHATGGHGRATTYSLHVVGQGGQETRQEQAEPAGEGAKRVSKKDANDIMAKYGFKKG